jgi:hypothetical protein
MTDAASAESIPAHAARQPNTAARRAEKLVLGSAPLASNTKRGLRAFAAEILPIVREIQASGVQQPPWSR